MAAALPPDALAVAPDEAASVMLRYQDLMGRFLDDQKAVMLAYLQGSAAPLEPAASEPVAIGPAVPAGVMLPPAAAPAEDMPAVEAEEAPSDPSPAAPSPAAVVQNDDPPAAAPAEAPPAELTIEAISARLIELVSERTGYPPAMLDLDLDLEADLGIDSIKRVEILGGLADMISGTEEDLQSKIELEQLTSIRTLRGILSCLKEAIFDAPSGGAAPGKPAAAGAPSAPVVSSPSSASASAASPADVEIQRAVVRLAECPLSTRSSLWSPSGTVLITDDERGIAADFAGRLAEFGLPVVLVRMQRDATASGTQNAATVDFCDPQAVDALLGRLRAQYGPIAGLIHLLPLATPPAGETPELRMRREVKSLYVLVRALEGDLRQAGAQGHAAVLAATAMGGGLGFGPDPLPPEFFAGQGGVLGFTKCLGQEWPEVLVRAVDFSADSLPGKIADCLIAELCDRQGPFEVGYLRGRRVTWKPESAPLPAQSDGKPLLSPAATVLVTGGARGITSAIVVEMARRYQPKLVLVGRSPQPAQAEPAETASLRTPAEIKAALIARCQREGRPAVPAQIEAAFGRLQAEREIRNTLQAARGWGRGRISLAGHPRRSGRAGASLGHRPAARRRGRGAACRRRDRGQAGPRQNARVVRARFQHQGRYRPAVGPAAAARAGQGAGAVCVHCQPLR